MKGWIKRGNGSWGIIDQCLVWLKESKKENKLLKEEVRELKEKAQNTNKVPKEVDETIANFMVRLEEAKKDWRSSRWTTRRKSKGKREFGG